MAIDLLEQILPHVKNHIYPAKIPISDWKIRVGDVPDGASPTLNDSNWTPIRPPDANWGAYDTTFWFRSSIRVPDEFSGSPIVVLLDIPDGLLFVNGKAHQGLDVHHREVLLTDKARTNQTYTLAIQAYSGRKKQQNTFSRADLAVLNPTARTLFTGLSLLKDLEKFYGQVTPEAKEIRELIRRTLIYLKYFKPDGDEYPNAIGRALKFLTETLATDFRTEIPGLVHLIGHSHLDVIWLWTIQEARRKAGRTTSTMLRLMDEFPDFRYAQSQAILYDFVKSDYPDLYKEIKQRVMEGRWEPLGSMWLEPDCNIPNGESLVRQIQYGRRFFKDEFGIESQILWIPDSFGFNWAMPQIMKKSGIRFFYTTKLTWNDTTSFPHNSFWWKGIDGSKVIAHIPSVGLEGHVNPKDLKKSWEAFLHKETQTDILQTYGYGDGGGGPTKEEFQAIAYLKTMPGLPSIRTGTVQEFFNILDQKGKELPTWDSELYLEKHRGTYTTHGWIKKENRECETLLYAAELLSSIAYLEGKRYPVSEIQKAWNILLTNQFHDIVSGTAIPESYDGVRSQYEKLRSIAAAVTSKALANFYRSSKKSAREFRFTVFNTLPWGRSEYVEVSIRSKEKRFIVTDHEGRVLEHQIVRRGKGRTILLCFLDRIPASSAFSFIVRPTQEKSSPAENWKTSSRLIETPLYRVRIDTHGQLTSLHDKRMRRELLRKGGRANVLQTFEDMPQQWEAWEINANYENRRTDLLKFKSARIVEQGPLRLALEIVRRSDRGSTVTQHVMFYHKSSRIDFKTHVKWNDSQILLKAAFPLNLNPGHASYEIQFGSIQRSAKPKSQADKAKFEVPAQQWADLSDAKFGVSLLNDCKYGYDSRDGTLRLTLLRSPRTPHPVDPIKPGNSITDQGEHSFTYSLYPHAGDWRKGETTRRARELNHPLIAIENATAKKHTPLILSIPGNIQVDAVKKAEEGKEIVLRVHECHGSAGKGHLDFGFVIEQAFECDLLENPLQKLKPSRTRLSVKFSPFEIKTLKLKFRQKKRR